METREKETNNGKKKRCARNTRNKEKGKGKIKIGTENMSNLWLSNP